MRQRTDPLGLNLPTRFFQRANGLEEMAYLDRKKPAKEATYVATAWRFNNRRRAAAPLDYYT
jgi:hypothetical protein